VIAHAAVVATLHRRSAAPAPAEQAIEWVEALEPVNIESVAPAEAEELEVPVRPVAQTREPAVTPPGDAPAALVDLPPPDAIPGAHAGAALRGKERDAWWAAARKIPVSPLDQRDGYDAIRAQIAGWNPKLVTGTYVPGRPGIAHADEMSSRLIPPAVITRVIQGSSDRFRICRGVGLPESATISGRVLVAFVIDPDGHVSGARDAGGTFPDDAVRRCIVRAVTHLSFPRRTDGDAQQVTIPVVLQD
jgi:hypothetical protein